MIKKLFAESRILFAAIFPVILLLASCGGPPRLLEMKGKKPELVRLGKVVNTEFDEYAPQLTADGSELVFTSNRPLNKDDDDPTDHIYRSAITGTGLAPAQYSSMDNKKEKKAGAVAYDYARKQVYFVLYDMPDGVGDCDLYVADLQGNEWKNIRNLGREVNSIEWDSHPSVSRDGNTLYFSSERTGNSDIYYCTRKPDGTWSAPVNMGRPVNTAGDEKSPFISNSGQYLYFASDDHPGFGGYDMFRSERKEKIWTEPLNLGIPYNSTEDDVFIATTLTGDTTYLASSRTGGLGGFDIYEIRNVEMREPAPPPPPVRKTLVVRYTIKNAFTKQTINAKVSYSAEGIDDYETQTLDDGIAQREVQPGKEYTVTASAGGFQSGVETFFYPSDESGIKDRELLLIPVREEERKIYGFVVEFDFDLFNIRPEEARKLDSAALVLTEFPNSTVVVSGHTDSMGTEVYNIKLGYNRAREVSKYVEKYLRQKGVRLRNSMEVRTYGETQPIDTNESDEGRQRNRRVEIGIIRNE